MQFVYLIEKIGWDKMHILGKCCIYVCQLSQIYALFPYLQITKKYCVKLLTEGEAKNMTYELKKYLTERLLEAIEKKRELSIREFSRSDLYDNDNVDEVNQWYSQLKSVIEANPPVAYYSTIIIVEQNNCVVDVEYEYSNEPRNIKTEISLRVKII